MKTAFIDLQGTLGGNPMGDVSDFEFYPCAFEGVRKLNSAGVKVIIITNQSRIAGGFLTLEEFHEKIGSIKAELEDNGAYIDGLYVCPHSRYDGCSCKKPLDGMVRQACDDHEIDVKKSYVIGDMGKSDIALANKIGAKGILVLTGAGHGSLNEYRHTWKEHEAHYVCKDISAAADFIVND